MASKRYTVYIYSSNELVGDKSFIASVDNGIAVCRGYAYLVMLSSDSKRYYGVVHGPEITTERTKEFMASF